jgi:hypothetical protein
MAVRPQPVKTAVGKVDSVEAKAVVAAAAVVAGAAAALRRRPLVPCRNFQTAIPTCKAFGPRRTTAMLSQPRHAEAAVVGEAAGPRAALEQPVVAARRVVVLRVVVPQVELWL